MKSVGWLRRTEPFWSNHANQWPQTEFVIKGRPRLNRWATSWAANFCDPSRWHRCRWTAIWDQNEQPAACTSSGIRVSRKPSPMPEQSILASNTGLSVWRCDQIVQDVRRKTLSLDDFLTTAANFNYTKNVYNSTALLNT